jgi:hypothetical protein
MAHVTITTTTPLGNIVADAVDKLQRAAEQIARAQALAATLPNAVAFEGGIMGGVAGSGADYQFALNTLAPALAAFMTAQAGAINTLDNGVVNP